jgi:hypothetical protein
MAARSTCSQVSLTVVGYPHSRKGDSHQRPIRVRSRTKMVMANYCILIVLPAGADPRGRQAPHEPPRTSARACHAYRALLPLTASNVAS